MNRHYTYRILECLYEVHNQLGPGLLESIYEEAVASELAANGFRVERQKPVPVIYKGKRLMNELRLDLIVDNKVILELKSVTEYKKIFEKQLFTYLALTNCEIGYVVNFNEADLRNGIHTVYNSRYSKD